MKTATNSATSERFYLDTSAHLERWSGTRLVRSEIGQLLGDREHSTSSHVRREWKRIVEGGCADMLNLLRESPGDIRELFSALGAGFGRSPAQSMRVFNLVTAGEPLDSDVDIRVRQYLRYRSRMQFEDQMVVRDGSECGLARNEVHQDSSGRWLLVARCKKGDSICRQDAFVEERRADAEAAGNALADPEVRDADRKMGKRFLAALPVPKDRKGKVCYAQTADISIALECGVDETMLTTDSSFETICPALGRKVHKLKASLRPASSLAGT